MLLLATSLLIPFSYSSAEVYAKDTSKNKIQSLDKKQNKELENRVNQVKKYFSEYHDLKDQYKDLIQEEQETTKITANDVELEQKAKDLQTKIADKKKGIEEQLGLTLKKEKKEMQKFSTSADVTFDIDMYFDDESDLYVLSGDFEWDNDDWTEDWDGTSGPIGGNDGIGLSIEEDIDIYDKEFITYYSSNSSTNKIDWIATDEAELNYDTNGLGIQFQDAYKGGYAYGYNAESGYALVFFDFEGAVPSDNDISINMGISHTWDNSEVNSISIGPWSIGFGYNRTTDKWDDEDNDIVSL